jgi:hypothetical protein
VLIASRVLRVAARAQAADGLTQVLLERLLALMAVHRRQRPLLLEGALYVVQQLDAAATPPALAPVLDAVRAKADKWTKHAELLPVALRLLAALVARGPADAFDAAARALVARLLKLVQAERSRTPALAALTTLLRGTFWLAEPGWLPDTGAGSPAAAAQAAAWSHVAHEGEGEPQATERLALLTEELFARRPVALDRDGVQAAAALVVQMAATRHARASAPSPRCLS